MMIISIVFLVVVVFSLKVFHWSWFIFSFSLKVLQLLLCNLLRNQASSYYFLFIMKIWFFSNSTFRILARNNKLSFFLNFFFFQMRKVMFERGQWMQMRRRKVVSLIMFSKNDSRWIYWDSKNWRCEQTNHYHNHHCHMFSFIIIIIIATCSQYHYNHYHHHHMFSTSWFSIHCRAHGSHFQLLEPRLIWLMRRKGEERRAALEKCSKDIKSFFDEVLRLFKIFQDNNIEKEEREKREWNGIDDEISLR